MIANALPRSLTAGSVDNAILRADGTGGTILQNSDIVIDDATTTTQANVAITNQHAGQTNSSLVLTPKGTGALIAGPKPTGTTSTGNARGAGAVDLQLFRSSATQVASGANSLCVGYESIASGGVSAAIGYQSISSGSFAFAAGYAVASGNYSAAIGGQNNRSTGASGTNSAMIGGSGNRAIDTNSIVLGGNSNTANATNAVCIGDSNWATGISSFTVGQWALSDRLRMFAHASGTFSANGDAQRARFVMRNKTTTNSAVELFLDGSSTRLTIPSGKVLALTINITGISSTGAAVAHYMRQYALKNVAGTCTEVYAPVTIGTDNAAGTSIALSAGDDANGEYLKVSVTGTASTIWRWVASVDAVEIAFGN